MNIDGIFTGIRTSMGIEDVGTLENLKLAVERYAKEKELEINFIGYQRGIMVLAVSATVAQLINYDIENFKKEIKKSSPLLIRKINFKTK